MSLYPPGYHDPPYHDPPYDGTADDFAQQVIPARRDAILSILNEQLADAGLDLRFEWTGDVPTPAAPPATTSAG
jgi:hypothetical protein